MDNTNHCRSAKKEAAKEEAKQEEMQSLKTAMQELFMQTEQQGAQLRELTRQLAHIGN